MQVAIVLNFSLASFEFSFSCVPGAPYAFNEISITYQKKVMSSHSSPVSLGNALAVTLVSVS